MPLHTPDLQTSLVVQGSLSSHVPPSLPATCLHSPEEASHESVVQTLLSSQFLGVPVQTPDLQTSPVVHLLPSSHVPPSLPATCLHSPEEESHESVVQTLLSSQFLGVPVQTPDLQTSPVVHLLPSSHVPPSLPA